MFYKHFSCLNHLILINVFFTFFHYIYIQYIHVFIFIQSLNWEKLIRVAQSIDLKTAFHWRNYLTQTRGGIYATLPTPNLHIF
jgi:hypothetical protein